MPAAQKVFVYGNHASLLDSIPKKGVKQFDIESIPGSASSISLKTARNAELVFLLHAPPLADSLWQIKQWKRQKPEVPIVVASTDISYQVIRTLFLAGANDVIPLPADSHQIMECLNAYSAENQGFAKSNSSISFQSETLAATVPEDEIRIEVSLLGNFSAKVNGQTLMLANQAKLLLAILACANNNKISREELVGQLWPEKLSSSPECARCSLNVELTKIRTALREITGIKHRFIVLEGNSYRFADGVSVRSSVDSFETLSAKIENEIDQTGKADETSVKQLFKVYQAHFMSDFSVKNREWMRVIRQRLSTLFGEIIEKTCIPLCRENQFARALTICNEALRRDPSIEVLHRRTMICYDALGECHNATQQFELCERTLRRLFNSSPSPETKLLLQRIAVNCGN